jgi:hypothetical protein
MFGGEYSNRKGNATLTPNVNQANNNKQVFPKKIPMFENIKNNSKNNNKTNSNRPSFELTKGYTVSNSENLKMLHELKGLIDIYINEFSNDDKMKVSFLIDNLSSYLRSGVRTFPYLQVCECKFRYNIAVEKKKKVPQGTSTV